MCLSVLLFLGVSWGLGVHVESSEPRTFAAVSMPIWQNGWHRCHFIISANSTAASVNITQNTETTSVEIGAGDSYTLTTNEADFPNQGLDDKVYYISSKQEIEVMMHYDDTYGTDWDDAYQVPERSAAGLRYYAISHPAPYSCTVPGAANTLQVVAYEDNTEVTISPPAGDGSVITMDRFGVYTMYNSQGANDFISESHVSSSKNVSVISGNLCLRNDPISTTYGGSAFTRMTPVTAFSDKFVAPVIGGDGQRGYTIKVVGSTDNTVVTVGDSEHTVNEGKILTVQLLDVTTITEVTCSSPCDVIQIAIGTRDKTATFMLNAIPLDMFYHFGFFSTTDQDYPHYITLVVKGLGPMDDVYLDDESLESQEWSSAGEFSYMYMVISKGVHRISSISRSLAAYVYCHTGDYSGGYGYAILPSLVSGGGDAPDGDYVLPDYTLRHNGTAVSADGAPLTPLCAAKYTTQMEAKAAGMALQVDARIGDSLCPDIARGELYIRTTTAGTQFAGDQMLITLDNTLAIHHTHTYGDVASCAEEIATYLGDHDNWRRPILDPEAGCSSMEFQPERFDVAGYIWECRDAQNQNETSPALLVASNVLLYDVNVVGVFNTSDGSELDGDCVQEYVLVAKERTVAMQAVINDAIAAGLCGDQGAARVIASSQSFGGFGNQGLLSSTFILDPRAEEGTFQAFLDCADAVYEFARQHANWGEPVLPQPPGCPRLEAEGGLFQDGEKRWSCVSV